MMLESNPFTQQIYNSGVHFRMCHWSMGYVVSASCVLVGFERSFVVCICMCFEQMMLELLEIHMQKHESRHKPYTLQK